MRDLNEEEGLEGLVMVSEGLIRSILDEPEALCQTLRTKDCEVFSVSRLSCGETAKVT